MLGVFPFYYQWWFFMKSIKILTMLLAICFSFSVSAQSDEGLNCEDSLRVYGDNWFPHHKFSSLYMLQEKEFDNMSTIWHSLDISVDTSRAFESDYVALYLNEEQMNSIEDSLASVLKIINSRICLHQHIYAEKIFAIEKQQVKSKGTQDILESLKKDHADSLNSIDPLKKDLDLIANSLKSVEAARFSKYPESNVRFDADSISYLKNLPLQKEERVDILDRIAAFLLEDNLFMNGDRVSGYIWSIMLTYNLEVAYADGLSESKLLDVIDAKAKAFAENIRNQ